MSEKREHHGNHSRRTQLGLPFPAASEAGETREGPRLSPRFLVLHALVLLFATAGLFFYLTREAPSTAPPPDATAALAKTVEVRIQPPAVIETIAPPAAEPAPEILPPWRRYAVTANVETDRPRIALILDDMGLDRQAAAEAVALRAPLTLSYLPYAGDLPAQTAQARRRGHELMLHLPMEPEGSTDPGPNALLVDLPPEELLRRLGINLDRFGSYVGLNNHMGSRFTADAPSMTAVLAEIRERGLLFLDSRTTDRSVAGEMARDMGVPYAVRDVFLDHVRTREAIRRQLRLLETVAKREGRAIAIGHPHPETLSVLAPWLETLDERGFELVPLTALIREPKTAVAQMEGEAAPHFETR